MSSPARALSAEQSAGAFAPSLLASLQDDLNGLNAAGAKEFLALAAALQSIAGHAHDIAGLSRQVTELTGPGESDEAVSRLQQLLTEAAHLQAMSQGSRAKLREILSRVERSNTSLARLLKLPLLLNTVGILSRIEASRLTDAAGNAASLTAGVDQLAENIERIVTQVADEGADLTQLVLHGVQQLDAVEGKQREQAASLISHSRTLLDSFRARSEASKTAARSIDEQYTGIHDASNRIVLSLQSEDIARQRVEHIQEALRHAAGLLETSGSLTDCLSILALQRSHLLTTHELVSKSLGSILESLQSLGPRLEALITQTAALESQTDNDGQSFATTIKQELGMLSAVLGPYFASARTVASTVDTVLPSLTTITSAVNEVEEIQASIRLMALNAEVKAAHLGGKGAAMGVLASELHKITGQSDGDTRVILEGLLGMDEILKALAGQRLTSNTSSLISAEGDEVTKGINHLVESIVMARQETSTRLAALQQQADTLRLELISACEVAERARALIKAFDDVLGKLDRNLEELGWDPDAALAPGAAANLTKLYSMEEEHQVHQQHFGAPGAGDVGAEDVVQKPAATDSELGENVELF